MTFKHSSTHNLYNPHDTYFKIKVKKKKTILINRFNKQNYVFLRDLVKFRVKYFGNFKYISQACFGQTRFFRFFFFF